MTHTPDGRRPAAPKGDAPTAGTRAKDELLTVTNMIALAGAVLLIGVLLENFAGMEPAYAVGRVVSMPLLVLAVVAGVRRRIWPSLILPVAALAAITATFLTGS
ncbi:hypothetical protein [Myceligenerans indicum]|uniref:Uncharacterized protein n=1 Tax=Myceligenerans indicum TaxID=2593663 RepID=A0ABS1LKK8_9MICO|nr:hypothetical protein [Myceligenerans indicum]MBL0886684.1 hypothetical protein [Myceligenerans indicum]